MARILTVTGSPSATSRTAAVVRHVERQLVDSGHDVSALAVRELSADALFAADATDPTIRGAIDAVHAADGLVVATPVYKASYTGLLKALLDLLPQYALAGKVVLPLALGGSPAHVLAIDYALRPVLTAMGARHVVAGYFLIDRLVTETAEGVVLEPSVDAALRAIVEGFGDALDRVPQSAPVARLAAAG
jgi:FMN reductase